MSRLRVNGGDVEHDQRALRMPPLEEVISLRVIISL
jgi:hypothetical protein